MTRSREFRQRWRYVGPYRVKRVLLPVDPDYDASIRGEIKRDEFAARERKLASIARIRAARWRSNGSRRG